MSEYGELEAGAGQALRAGLRQLPVPALSADFDARVLAAVENPWWRLPSRAALQALLRPLLGGAACSLVVTLGLYAWTAALPLESRPKLPAGRGDVALDRRDPQPAADPFPTTPTLDSFSVLRWTAPAPGRGAGPTPAARPKPERGSAGPAGRTTG